MAIMYERDGQKFLLPDDAEPRKGEVRDVVKFLTELDYKSCSFWGISPESLTLLLTVSLKASMIVDEGRYPRFTIVTGEQKQGRELIPLAGLELTPEVLARIAPIVLPRPFGLHVIDGGQVLSAKSLVRLQTHLTNFPFPVGRSPGLLINVTGPGRLLVQTTPFEFQVRQDEFWVQWRHPVVTVDLIKKLRSNILLRNGNPREISNEFFNLEQLLLYVWDFMLGQVRAEAHGGALVILPSDPIPNEILWIPYNAIAHLGDALFQRAYGSMSADSLHDLCAAIAGLAAVDGCVAFDQSLSLIGFGGRILTSGPPDELPAELKKKGTRHHSAYWLCRNVQGAVAQVVSQDGSVTVFEGQNGEVRHFRAGLSPESHGKLPI